MFIDILIWIVPLCFTLWYAEAVYNHPAAYDASTSEFQVIQEEESLTTHSTVERLPSLFKFRGALQKPQSRDKFTSDVQKNRVRAGAPRKNTILALKRRHRTPSTDKLIFQSLSSQTGAFNYASDVKNLVGKRGSRLASRIEQRSVLQTGVVCVTNGWSNEVDFGGWDASRDRGLSWVDDVSWY